MQARTTQFDSSFSAAVNSARLVVLVSLPLLLAELPVRDACLTR
jgi:hypothetical protein